MPRRQLSAREQRLYEEGGFRLEGRRRSQAAAERALLHAACRILTAWGAGLHSVGATLALPSSRALARWRRGKSAIAPRTKERIAIVIALYDRLIESNDQLGLGTLPSLKRAGRRNLPGRAVLASGRLSDLLALWRQLVLAEEAAAARAVRRSRGRGRRRR